MNTFIGRKRELQALQKAYDSEGFQMYVIYGRRRIGKSTLITEFVKDKKAVYYTARKSGIDRNVELWSNSILGELTPDMPGLSLNSVDDILKFLAAQCKDERIVIVLDEIPYMAEADPGFLSALQYYIDTQYLFGKMMLIVCGSSVSFMEDEVLSEKSPIFGRRTGQIRLKAFDYLESQEFIPQYSVEEKAICYGITGGVAKYLSLLDDSKSLDENIIDLFFSTTGYLYEETTNLLTQEFRSTTTYNDILFALSSGNNKINDIADKTHIDATTVSHALKNLIATGIVTKEMAITDESNKKKVQYNITDHMFRFWFKFVPDGTTMIELGRGKYYYEHMVKGKLHEYMGNTFEAMCRHYILVANLNDKLPYFLTSVGKWWGSNPLTKEQTDIDVVALDPISHIAVLGECKFKNEPIDKNVFESLLQRKNLISKEYKTDYFILFSLSGFSKWIIENAKEQKILLVDLDDMYATANNSL